MRNDERRCLLASGWKTHLGKMLMAVLLVGVSAVSAAAEPTRMRQEDGRRLSIGLALTSLAFGGDANVAGADRETGLEVTGAVAWPLGPRWGLGAEVDLWAKESSDVTTYLWRGYGVVIRTLGDAALWRLRGGVGWVILDETEIGNRADGPSATIGVERDVPLRGRQRLTPFLRWSVSRDVEVIQGGRATGFTENPSTVSFGLAWTFG